MWFYLQDWDNPSYNHCDIRIGMVPVCFFSLLENEESNLKYLYMHIINIFLRWCGQDFCLMSAL